MNGQKNISEKVLKLLNKIRQNKIYGSVEVYFEGGEITQVTQRIISKINKTSKVNPEKNKISGLKTNSKFQGTTTLTSSQEFAEITTKI